MIDPLLNDQTGKVQCICNLFCITNWSILKCLILLIFGFHHGIAKAQKHKNDEITFPSECCKNCLKKFEIDFQIEKYGHNLLEC